MMFTSLSIAILFGLSASASAATAPANPIQVASSKFLGFRNASNDQSIRSPGYMGSIGSTYILTFGPGTGFKNATTRTNDCAYVASSNGAGIPSSNVLSYTDVNTQNGLCGGTPQVADFCPPLSQGGDGDSGIKLTNIIGINSTYGILYTTDISCNATSDCGPDGAGYAVVQLQGSTPVCTRPYGHNIWAPSEPYWGELSALLANDGYIYTYASAPNNAVVVARVPQAQAFLLNSYQYYHGQSAGFTSQRIQTASLTKTSPELIGVITNQNLGGSTFYSTYYSRYVFITCTNNQGIFYAQTATAPQGPWSNAVRLYQPPYQLNQAFKANVQPKFFSSDGKTIVISYSDNDNQGVAQITFK